MKNLLILLFACCRLGVSAQDSFASILWSIERNNTTLSALRQQADAQLIANKTGLYLPNPEVEVNYLWGDPSSMGNRTDLNIRQEFDFPTAYRYRSQLVGVQNLRVELEYALQCNEMLQQARELCIDLVYRFKLREEYAKRFDSANRMAMAYETRFERGDATILDRNKSGLNLLSTRKAMEMNEVEIEALVAELTMMNGGVVPKALPDEYPDSLPVSDFAQWFDAINEDNPMLCLALQNVELSRKQEQVSRAMSLPKFSTGYMSERIAGTTLQGVSFGVSIPLWENRNTVRQARMQRLAMESVERDIRLQFESGLKADFDRAQRLFRMLNNYRRIMPQAGSGELLWKAFELGEISLIEYLLELTAAYEAEDACLETEHEYQLAVSRLRRWE